MKIAILEADHVADELVAEHGDYPAMFKTLLSDVDQALAYDVYTVIDDQFPEHLNYDGFLITGSKFSAYDDLPWIEKLKQLILDIHQQQKPLIGICFGHQLIAIALGGETKKADQGWGVGIFQSDLIEVPAWMASIPESGTFNLLVSHQDQVTRLPDGAVLLGSNYFCPNAMMQVGDHTLTFQGHPEFTKLYCNVLMNKRQEILGEEIYSKGVASLNSVENGRLIAQWILEFLKYNPKEMD